MYNKRVNGKAFSRTSSQICASPDEELLEAVLNNNDSKIKEVIRNNEYLLRFTYPDYCNKTILLIACSEDGVISQTVKELLELKANPNYSVDDDGWEALHLAACKTDYHILDVLLKKNHGDVNVTDKFGHNALHILIRYGRRESPNFFRCAELLVEMGIDVKHEDSKNRTVLYWANSYGIGEEIKKIINNQTLSGRNIPQQISNNNVKREGEILMKYLKNNSEAEFIDFKGGNIKDLVDYHDETNTLLQMCCQRNLTKSALHLLAKGADVNQTCKKTLKPIEIAAENGFSGLFEILLAKYNPITQIPEGLFITVLKYIDRKYHNNEGCYKALMKKLKEADSDEISLKLNETDTDNFTPLHYAVRYGNQNIVEELLSFGASLGAKNNYGVMPVQDIQPEKLKKYLDKCVIFNTNKRLSEKENFQVKFNYRCIIPPYAKSSHSEANSLKDPEAAEGKSTVQKELVAETKVIFFMSKTSEYKHLLNHPVIVSFLLMKWLRIQWVFWTNLLFYVTFSLSLVSYIFTDYAYFSPEEKSTNHNLFVYISYIFLSITLIILMLRELFQICVAPTKYVTNWENYLEILLIILTATIVFESLPATNTRKQLSSLSILLAAFELVLMLGNHPSFSTNVVMLRTVLLNFFKFLMWYSLLIIAFAVSFYLLFASDTVETKIPGNNTEVSNSVDFENLGRSIFKTIIMLSGEFDTNNIKFDTIPSRIIFALFIFMIAIILLNLLNGLAVSDTQMIKKDAELVGHIARAQHIRYVESMLVGNILPANLMQKLSNFCCCLSIPHNWNYRLCRYLAENVNLFPKYLKNYELIFLPYKYGSVHSDSFKHKKGKSCAPCSEIYLDSEIVRRTNTIIQAREDEKANDLESLKSDMKLVLHFLKPTKDK